jgi:hypothetical protein
LPLNNATNVKANTSPTATFSTVMSSATLNATTFTLKQGTTAITSVVTYAGTTATINPAADFAPNVLITASISTGAKNAAGTPLAAAYTWTFTTEAAPTVTATTPQNTATNVPINVSPTATFSTAMNPATINATTFTLKQGTTPIAAVVSYVGNTATINPAANLAATTLYTASITTGATSAGGAALASAFTWTFTTGSTAAAPVVVSTCPLNNAVGVLTTAQICAVFNKAMDPLTLTALTFTLKQGLNNVVGTVSYDAATLTATFKPTTPMGLNLPYTATVTTGAKDTSGVALAADKVWSWNTAACSQQPIALGSAANFAALAGSTITNTGPTSITGDIGVSPGTGITGFGPGVVIGTQHSGDGVSAQGIADLTTAYNEAAGRVLCPVSVAGNLGGMTLAPGLYKSTGSLEISAGDLTLDGQGDPTAVFIFQMASTLNTTSGRQVFLINGASAQNIFWQVGTSATIGSTSSIFGTVMADQAITLSTGATVTGRLLARIAATNFDSNVVVLP